MSRAAGLGCAALLLAGCLPLAWEEEPRPDGGARTGGSGGGLPIGGVAGGFGGGGMGGGVGGFGGGGMQPIGGGAPDLDGGFRPPSPVITGSFNGGATRPGPFPRGPLRSSTLAIVPGTRKLVAVVDDADALFVLDTPNRRIMFPPGARPSSVAVAPDGLTAWVALRGAGSVARVTLATGVQTLVPVGAEPTGVALSPSGRRLVVATFGERTVTVLDTLTLGSVAVDVGGHPRALTITDDGDADDADEAAWVTLFYGELVSEGTDDGRRGVVVEVSLGSTPAVTSRVTLGSLFTGLGGVCVPNQLHAIAQQGPSLYVTHVCAAPAAPQGPLASLHAGLSVINLAARTEDLSMNGSRVLQSDAPLRSLLANPIDVVPFAGAVLVLAQGSNSVQVLGETVSTRVGLDRFYAPGQGPQFDDPAMGVPTGVIGVDTEAFVLDATGRRVLELAPRFGPMSPVAVFPFETLPPPASPLYVERVGRRHFATSEGLWSSQNSVACTSCHPDGLTDGLTWVFTAGPRQTPSLSGTFERGRRAAHRAQGWTATADEIADVEGLVRTLCGGSGAIGLDAGIPLNVGYPGPGGISRHDGLSSSSRSLVLSTGRRDWLELEEWLVSLPRPPASARLDPLAVARGRQLFASGGCAACHGGALWTVSRVPYEPSLLKNGSAVGDDGVPSQPSGLRVQPLSGAMLWSPALNTDTLKVAPEGVSINNLPVNIGPERITCVLRDVGTFDRADPLEVKSNGQPAQGEKGFNPPSLFGLATSAPYLHHGKAKTLTELFSAPWARHTQAWSPGFLSTADGGVNPGEVRDLVAFLESIDEQTVPFPQPFGTDLCGAY